MSLGRISRIMIGMLVITLSIGASSIKSERILADKDRAVFSDINGHWAYATIMWAANLGIVKGMGDGTFGPNRNVTEAEFLTMLFNAFPEELFQLFRQGLGIPIIIHTP
jgi:hypothetical protein